MYQKWQYTKQFRLILHIIKINRWPPDFFFLWRSTSLLRITCTAKIDGIKQLQSQSVWVHETFNSLLYIYFNWYLRALFFFFSSQGFKWINYDSITAKSLMHRSIKALETVVKKKKKKNRSVCHENAFWFLNYMSNSVFICARLRAAKAALFFSCSALHFYISHRSNLNVFLLMFYI